MTAPAGASEGCPWPGRDAEYQRYHDEEWGVPLVDDRALFEKIVLEGFQAGLSWLVILRKRPHFRTVFDGFDPEVIARYDTAKVEALAADAGIVRNRAKILASIDNARAALRVAEMGGLARFLWEFVDGVPIQNAFRTMADVPAETDISRAISKALKAEGFRFVGPTTVYAMMQSTGMVNDHLTGCPRHADCAEMGRTAVL